MAHGNSPKLTSSSLLPDFGPTHSGFRRPQGVGGGGKIDVAFPREQQTCPSGHLQSHASPSLKWSLYCLIGLKDGLPFVEEAVHVSIDDDGAVDTEVVKYTLAGVCFLRLRVTGG